MEKLITGMILDSKKASELIEAFGIGITIGLDENTDVGEAIEADDKFQVIINYGHGVQLALVQDEKENPVVIELQSLKGSCVDGEWCAVI